MSNVSKLAFLAVLLMAACHEDPLWCPDQPGNTCKDAGSDSQSRCTSNDQCEAPLAVCDLAGSMMCVQCIAPDQTSACSGGTPACGSDNACRACRAHSECASSACLSDGSCGAESNVAYVDPAGTDNSTCTKATPCTNVAKALATNRPYVKFRGTTNEQVTINNQNVTLLAEPGAKLSSTTPGVILRVDGSSVVTIIDLAISDALGTGGIGITLPAGNTAMLTLRRVRVTGNAGGGISASGGTLTVSRSTISGNAGGGIAINGAQFDITNNFIVGNGNPTVTQSYGGVQLSSVNTGTRRFEFNTVTGNTAAMNATTGVVCALVNQAITFSSNIVYDNQTSGTGTQVSNTGSNCNWTYSDIGPQTVAGTGNKNVNPAFVNATQGDFHITAASPCKDAADPSATLDIDIDGDVRPKGAARDIGADETP